jgi:hypothetical protein
LAGHVLIGRGDLLLDDLQVVLAGGELGALERVLAVVALEVQVADRVAGLDPVLAHQEVDGVDGLDVVGRARDRDVLVREDVRRPAREVQEQVLLLHVGQQRADDRGAEHQAEPDHVARELLVGGDGLLRVIARVLDLDLHLAAADPARLVLGVPVEVRALHHRLAVGREDAAEVREVAERDLLRARPRARLDRLLPRAGRLFLRSPLATRRHDQREHHREQSDTPHLTLSFRWTSPASPSRANSRTATIAAP